MSNFTESCKWLWSEYRPYRTLVGILTCASVFVSTMAVYWESCSGRFLVLLSTVVTFWVTEVVPLWVTAIAIPLAVVLLRVMAGPDGVTMDADAASALLFGEMFGTVQLTLLAVFAMGEALKRHGPLRYLSEEQVLKAARWNWSAVTLALMTFVLFLAIGVGNIAALYLAVLAVSPILDRLPASSLHSQMLMVGLMIAGVISGIVSPVASASSVFTYDQAQQSGFGRLLGWPVWLSVMVPLCTVSTLVGWGVLHLANWTTPKYVDLSKDTELAASAPKEPRPRDTNSILMTAFVCLVCVLTITGWVVSGVFPGYLGAMGIVSIFPVVAFFGSGLLTTEDLGCCIPWHVILLAIGGRALATAAKHSGYMQHLADQYLEGVHWFVLLLVPGIFSIYKSHFVCTVLFLPAMIASNRGMHLEGQEEGAIRYFLTFLGCNIGMGLPISGLSSLILYEMRDRQGKRRLPTLFFLKYGMAGSVIYFALIAGLAEPFLRSVISLYH